MVIHQNSYSYLNLSPFNQNLFQLLLHWHFSIWTRWTTWGCSWEWWWWAWSHFSLLSSSSWASIFMSEYPPSLYQQISAWNCTAFHEPSRIGLTWICWSSGREITRGNRAVTFCMTLKLQLGWNWVTRVAGVVTVISAAGDLHPVAPFPELKCNPAHCVHCTLHTANADLMWAVCYAACQVKCCSVLRSSGNEWKCPLSSLLPFFFSKNFNVTQNAVQKDIKHFSTLPQWPMLLKHVMS